MAAEVMVTARQKGQLEKEGYHLVQLKTQLALEKSSISMIFHDIPKYSEITCILLESSLTSIKSSATKGFLT